MGTLLAVWRERIPPPYPPFRREGCARVAPPITRGVFQRGLSAVVMKLGQEVIQSTWWNPIRLSSMWNKWGVQP